MPDYRDIELEKAVDSFAKAMKQKLMDNAHKSGWSDLTKYEIYTRLKEEMEELLEAIMDDPPYVVGQECLDIANFCMFMYVVWGTGEKVENSLGV